MESARGPRLGADLAAAACMFAGGVHLGLALQHHGAASWHTWLFVADGLAFFVAAGWLVLRIGRLGWQVAGTLSGLTVLAYAASRTIGLPGHQVEPWDANGLATSGLEIFVALGAFIAMRRRTPIRRVVVIPSRPRVAAASGRAAGQRPATGFALASRPLPGTMRASGDSSLGSYVSRVPRS